MNTVCSACNATNRVPEDRLSDGAKCGRCGHELFDGEVINATAETLDKLLQDGLPVVVDFWRRGAAPASTLRPFSKTSPPSGGQSPFRQGQYRGRA
ncbi:Thioredoxin-2 [Serratia rubidaea]|uniref:Thioredoxin-2 n=1 Tax=Serratia rubidaea TaxID=61652 RepID=A0A4V6JIR9_SERRU|nr:Thioredoxin-2 [Serratia rubidaea]